MRITIKKLQGGECILDILPTTTITEIKNQVFEKLGIPVQEQKLLLVGRTLADGQTVAGYPTIKEGSKINLVVKKPERPVTKSEEPATKSEETAKKSEEPANKSEEPDKKSEEPTKKSDEPAKKPEEASKKRKGLYEVLIQHFKKQGVNDTEATNTAKRLLSTIEDKFKKMSWDDIDKLSLDCLMDECGLRQVLVDKDADCEDTL